MDSINRNRILEAKSRFFRDWQNHQKGSLSFQATYQLIRDFEVLGSYLYRVRAELAPSDPFRVALEDFVASVSHEIVALQSETKSNAYAELVSEYRRIWRENLPLFLLTALLFIAGLYLGWRVALHEPEYVSAIVGQSMIEQVLEKSRWFDRIQSNPIMYGFQIAINNIKVGIMCFVAGALFGLGGLVLLSYNGLLFGALMGFCYVHQFHDQLGAFVLSHGPLELTIIVASTFASFLFGRVFYMRPYSCFRIRMAKAGREAAIIVGGILPWLCLAAILEVGVSPWPFYPLKVKIGLGILAAVLFWGWTFYPSPKVPTTFRERSPKEVGTFGEFRY